MSRTYVGGKVGQIRDKVVGEDALEIPAHMGGAEGDQEHLVDVPWPELLFKPLQNCATHSSEHASLLPSFLYARGVSMQTPAKHIQGLTYMTYLNATAHVSVGRTGHFTGGTLI